jgi:hypothetical protein
MTFRNIGIFLSTVPVKNIGMAVVHKELLEYESAVNNWIRQGVSFLTIGYLLHF